MITVKKTEFNKLFKLACSGWQTKFTEKFKNEIFSDELEFEESFLDEMEAACNAEQLKVFKQVFKTYVKEDLFSIKTYSEVCKKLGVEELTEKDFKQFGEDSKKMLAFHKIKNIEKLFNGSWKPNWKNTSQYKWYPYFDINSSGGLGGVFFSSFFLSFRGSTGVYKDEKTASFVGETFIKIYEDLM